MKNNVAHHFGSAAVSMQLLGLVPGLRRAWEADIWLAARFDAQQMREHCLIGSEWARETIVSADPAAMRYSDPGEYPFQSELLRRRVARRFIEFGPARELAAAPERQHLIELSEPARWLSFAYQNRMGVASHFIRELHDRLEKCKFAELTALRSEIDLLGAMSGRHAVSTSQKLWNLIASAPIGFSEALPLTTERINIDQKFDFVVDAEKVVEPSGLRGRLTVRMFGVGVDIGKPMGATGNLIFFGRALPDGFRCYDNYEGEEELAICCVAWGAAIDTLIESIRRV